MPALLKAIREEGEISEKSGASLKAIVSSFSENFSSGAGKHVGA